MSGRLLSAPFLAAVVVASRLDWRPRRATVAAVAALALGLASAYSPLRATADYGGETERSQFPHGIVDERGWYFPAAGLVHLFPGPGIPRHRYTARGLRTTKNVEVTYTLGYLGYFAPRATHVIDTYALADPLLARLPVDRSKPWRIGHFLRTIPPGYLETLENGRNRIEDPKLAGYYDIVAYVTRGPVLDGRRIVTALKWDLGAYDFLLEGPWHGS